MRAITLFLLFTLTATGLKAQEEVERYGPTGTKILFVLDGSGSMKEKWGSSTKWDIARDLLVHLADSIGQADTSVEFGVRIFGHQSPRSADDCQDSKLEVPMARGGAEHSARISTTLDSITPQGHTPIAYSLFLSPPDFADEGLWTNAIILITDGKENCDGNPCAAAQLLERNRISLRPFIIGLGLDSAEALNFDCVGTYFDAADEEAFDDVIDVVVSQAINSTTAQIDLLDKSGAPTITDLPVTLYDHYSGEVRYNFIHTLDPEGRPDTLYLDPVGKYDLEVHSIPPLRKLGIQLEPGKHNIIDLHVLSGTFYVEIQNEKRATGVQTIVREANSPEILYMHDMRMDLDYISADYDYEYLTLPRGSDRSEFLDVSQEREVVIDYPGRLSMLVREPGIASLYTMRGEVFVKIHEFRSIVGKENLELQPGEYRAVYRPDKERRADLSKTTTFEISSGKTTLVRF